jgi:hypothetical protein
MRIPFRIPAIVQSTFGSWLVHILYSFIKVPKVGISKVIVYLFDIFYPFVLPIYNFFADWKLVLFYMLKSFLVLSCIILSLLLITLVLLQRAEEGAFRRALSAGQGLDAQELVYKTIYFAILYVVIINITQGVFYHIYLKNI